MSQQEQIKAILEKDEREAVQKAKADTSCWGYREADNDQGWEGKVFANPEARKAAGAEWVDSPHEFIVAKEQREQEEQDKAAKKLAADRAAERRARQPQREDAEPDTAGDDRPKGKGGKHG